MRMGTWHYAVPGRRSKSLLKATSFQEQSWVDVQLACSTLNVSSVTWCAIQVWSQELWLDPNTVWHSIPDQSKFLNAGKTVRGQGYNGQEVEMVKVLEYHVDFRYAQKVYQSCVNVVNPSTSGSVMDLLCGPWGGALCSPKRFSNHCNITLLYYKQCQLSFRLLDYLGSLSNGYAPFQINYFLHNIDNQEDPEVRSLTKTGNETGKVIVPHNPTVVPCNLEAKEGI